MSEQTTERAPHLHRGSERHTWARLDTAEILKRFYFLERALTITCAAWIPALSRLETKAALARAAWQNMLTGDALRERVFELRYPSRLLEEDADALLIRLFESSLNAPNGVGMIEGMATVLVPALRSGYDEYLRAADALSDGPSRRFLEAAVRDKVEQQDVFAAVLEAEPTDEADRRRAAAWVRELADTLERVGGVGLGQVAKDVEVATVLPGGERFRLAEQPARDDRYLVNSFYWPDALNSDFAYGEGIMLQLRAAVSHLNEVWAVETAGAMLWALADELGWAFVADAARWLYDEARHMMMGVERLDAWGFERAKVPLGSYIFEACAGEDALYRLGMLGYFETKNIGKKRERAQEFGSIGDATSQRHMEFDWADETMHAEYGRRWLRALLEARGRSGDDWPEVLERCERLVAERVARATDEERSRIGACANELIQLAVGRAEPSRSR